MLELAIEGEACEYTEMYPEFRHLALEEGHHAAVTEMDEPIEESRERAQVFQSVRVKAAGRAPVFVLAAAVGLAGTVSCGHAVDFAQRELQTAAQSGAQSTTANARSMPRSRLSACPSTANCVSSDATGLDQRIAPLRLLMSADEAWAALLEAVATLPRTHVTMASGSYLHAEVRSAVFRFVDDLEFELRPAQAVIAVRSASRVGRSDFGVNRRRVEALRNHLAQKGLVHGS